MGWIERLHSVVWGLPTLVLIIGTGLYLSYSTGFAQISLLPKALKTFCKKLSGSGKNEKGISSFQSLCTALAATVGTGNIAGVAGAIAIGGPGAIFWMWVCALLGMIIKFAEAALAVHFRVRDPEGAPTGGPMYMIERGLGGRWKWLAKLYCIFGLIAAMGVGNATQVNAVIDGFRSATTSFQIPWPIYANGVIGALLALTTAYLLLGGVRRIGAAAEKLIPFAAVAYILLGIGVVLMNSARVPEAFRAILQGAFSPRAATGGVIVSALMALRTGVSRGVFTNEAGMGTASISYAAADDADPVSQGLMGIVEVFLDTIVICTVTALVILCSGAQILYGVDEGAALTSRAFQMVYGNWSVLALAVFLALFAFATMLGWGMYGAKCAQYLFGYKIWVPFVLLQSAVVVVSAYVTTGTVWAVAEVMNGLMAIPNLIALVALCPVLKKLLNHPSHGRKSLSCRFRK